MRHQTFAWYQHLIRILEILCWKYRFNDKTALKNPSLVYDRLCEQQHNSTAPKKKLESLLLAKPKKEVKTITPKKPLAEEILFGKFSSKGGVVYVDEENDEINLRLEGSVKNKDTVS